MAAGVGDQQARGGCVVRQFAFELVVQAPLIAKDRQSTGVFDQCRGGDGGVGRIPQRGGEVAFHALGQGERETAARQPGAVVVLRDVPPGHGGGHADDGHDDRQQHPFIEPVKWIHPGSLPVYGRAGDRVGLLD